MNEICDVKVYGEPISKGRGFAVLVTLSDYAGSTQLDLRTWFETRPGDPDTFRPTQKGVSVRIGQLPKVLAGLRAVEAEAIWSGLLRPRDYTAAGLPVPEEITGRRQ